jgi:hypothetical protein
VIGRGRNALIVLGERLPPIERECTSLPDRRSAQRSVGVAEHVGGMLQWKYTTDICR